MSVARKVTITRTGMKGVHLYIAVDGENDGRAYQTTLNERGFE